MIIKVNPHKIELVKEEPVNEREIDISRCHFEFSDEITDDYVKEAYFTLNGKSYKVLIQDNECQFPSEVLKEKGDIEIGVVAFKVENEEEIKRYNPSPAYFNTWIGSLKDAENTEPITPTDKEQIEQMLANINIDANKVGKITTITITYKDGTTKDVTLEDGKSIEYNWSGTSLGIRQEGQSQYEYVNLKGDKGEPGAIKMIIVAELPSTGQDDTIYLVPLENPESQENNYAEYIYVNNKWELLGKIGIQVDLTDYYTKTETNNLLNTKQEKITNDNKLSASLISGLSNVATSGSYNDLSNKPDLSVYELSSNKVVSISSSSTDTQYPSAKCVYDLIGDLETILTTLDIGGGAN